MDVVNGGTPNGGKCADDGGRHVSNFDGREPHYSIEGRNEKKVGEEDGEDEKETSRDLFELTAYISGKV